MFNGTRQSGKTGPPLSSTVNCKRTVVPYAQGKEQKAVRTLKVEVRNLHAEGEEIKRLSYSKGQPAPTQKNKTAMS